MYVYDFQISITLLKTQPHRKRLLNCLENYAVQNDYRVVVKSL